MLHIAIPAERVVTSTGKVHVRHTDRPRTECQSQSFRAPYVATVTAEDAPITCVPCHRYWHGA